MEYIIETKPAFTVIGLELKGNSCNESFPQLWEIFSGRVNEVKPLAAPLLNAYGVCSNFDETTKTFDYMAGLEVIESSTPPEGMVKKHIPEQTYAVFTCTLPTLMKTIESIFQEWLPQSEYKHTMGPEFELYDKQFDPTVPESVLYLYIPVEKKTI